MRRPGNCIKLRPWLPGEDSSNLVLLADVQRGKDQRIIGSRLNSSPCITVHPSDQARIE